MPDEARTSLQVAGQVPLEELAFGSTEEDVDGAHGCGNPPGSRDSNFSGTRPAQRGPKSDARGKPRYQAAYDEYKNSEARALHRGRGASGNPANRFEALHVDLDAVDPAKEEERPKLATKFYRDATKTIIARNHSPDVSFETSVNPYRGCEHGCAYCFARPTHEYLGFSAGLDFESKIMVKENAPELLEAELASPKWKPQTLVMSGVTDPYQPIERKLQITRRCLQVLAKFRNPVGMLTKNRLVTRDIDVMKELAVHHAVAINISVTSLDPKLQRILESRTSPPQARLDAVAQLRDAGIPVGVMVAPIFERWLDEHFPGHKEKVLGRIRHMRGGQLYDSRWSKRQAGEGIFAEQVGAMFEVACRRAGIGERLKLSTAAFRRPVDQLDLL